MGLLSLPSSPTAMGPTLPGSARCRVLQRSAVLHGRRHFMAAGAVGAWQRQRHAARCHGHIWPPYPGLGIPNHQNETVLVLKAMVLVFGDHVMKPLYPRLPTVLTNKLMKFQNMHKPR